MGDYYNKTRNAISVTLRRGATISIAPKTWCYIDDEDEGTTSLIEVMRKGFLSRAIVPSRPPAPPVAAAPAKPNVVVVVVPQAAMATPAVINAAVAAATPTLEAAEVSLPVVDGVLDVATTSVAAGSESSSKPSVPQFESKSARRNK